MRVIDLLSRLHWGKVAGLLIFHAGALSAPFVFSWTMPPLALAIWFFIGPVGTCVGLHRLLTHRSFETYWFVEYPVAVCGAVSLQRPFQWQRTHLHHHKETDQPGRDPHTPKEGRFWAFVGWIIVKKPQNPQGEVHLNQTEYTRSAIERLKNDRFHVLLNRFYWVPATVLAVVLYLLGGYPAVAWGVCVPFVVAWNSIWYLNMAGHSAKTLRTDIKNYAYNSKIAGWLTAGEWHGNHHVYPGSARQGLKWYEIDIPWYLIRVGQFLGLVWGVNLPR